VKGGSSVLGVLAGYGDGAGADAARGRS